MNRRKVNRVSYVSGSAMLYAIIVVVVVTTMSAMILMTAGMSEQLLASSIKRRMAELYSYQGILSCAAGGEYDFEKSINYDESVHHVLKMTTWGLYDIVRTTLKTRGGDTNDMRIALMGRGQEQDNGKALVLSASTYPLQVGRGVTIIGPCYVPLGAAKGYDGGDVRQLELYQSEEYFPDLFGNGLIARRLDVAPAMRETQSRIVISDSVSKRFEDPTYMVCGDTVIVSNAVTGNVIIVADVLLVDSSATVHNAIFKGRKVQISDGFSGQLQVFASDTLLVGKRCRFRYPTIIGLVPDGDMPAFLNIGDATAVYGEVIACRRFDIRDPGDMLRMDNVYVIGAVYSSMNLKFTGVCHGGIISRWTFGQPGGMAQRNFISNLNVNADALPSYFSYSTVFPFGTGHKLVQWL